MPMQYLELDNLFQRPLFDFRSSTKGSSFCMMNLEREDLTWNVRIKDYQEK